ncbi:MAG: hypothetical protein QOI02_134 [Actinomycetota bacterium]|nr:hypothetical protein [Actinomycetota bacterium]
MKLLGIPALTVVAVLLALSGCTSATGQDAIRASPSPRNIATAVAAKRDIISVLVVGGSVQANPEYVVSAPDSGSVTFSRKRASEAGDPIAMVGSTRVALATKGVVTRQLVSDGAPVVKNSPIAVVQYAGFGIPVQVPATQLYRIYSQPVSGKASVTGGPAGLTCMLVPVPSGTSDAEAQPGYKPVVCLLPLSAKVVADLPAQVGVQTASAKSVLALPVSAVSGSAGQGEVTLVANGKQSLVHVKLGISDGAYVQIRSGLKSGDKVADFAPGLN